MKVVSIYLLMLLIFAFIPPLGAQNGVDDLIIKSQNLFQEADYEKSILTLEKALQACEKDKNTRQKIPCYSLLCQNYLAQSKLVQAQKMLQSAEEIVAQKNLKEQAMLIELYLTRGDLELRKGRREAAQEAYQKAQETLQNQSKKNPDLEARIYSSLGLLSWNSLKRKEALDFQTQALSIRQKIHGEVHPSVAASYNDMGLIYSQSEEYRLALDYYEKARKIYTQFYSDVHPSQANILTNMAIVQWYEKDYQSALLNFEEALQIRESLYGASHPNVAFILNYQAQVFLDEGNFKEAKSLSLKALEIYKKNYPQKHPEIAKTQQLLGQIALKADEYKEAIAYYQASMISNVQDFDSQDYFQNPKLENYLDGDVLLQSFLLKARALEARYQNHSLRKDELLNAQALLHKGDQLIDKIRISRINKADKIALGQIAAELYEDAIRITMQLADVSIFKKSYYEDAFYFSEKSKSAVLLSAISEADAKSFANIPADILAVEQDLKSKIAYYEQVIAQAEERESQADNQSTLFQLKQEYQGFSQKLEQDYPDYYDLKYNVNMASVSDIQRNLNPEEQLISYFLSPKTKRVYIFSISPTKFKIFDRSDDLNYQRQLRGLKNAIKSQKQTLFEETSSTLYTLLLDKVILSKTKKLIIIPDGALSTLPFELLLNKKPWGSYENLPYLIREYRLSYDFSSTLYLQSFFLKKPVFIATRQALLYAPINFEGKLNSLPDTEEEVQEIAQILETNAIKAQVKMHQEADEHSLKTSRLQDYHYLHFATHGTVDEQNPELSRIFLAASPNSESSEDGGLYSGEIYNLNMEAKLVTLSACQTGLGKFSRGEGLIGLSRALRYAGAHNLMISFWSVSDASTAQLMIEFYSSLCAHPEKESFAYSLREAKLKLIQSKDYAAPYYWAPFVCIGK